MRESRFSEAQIAEILKEGESGVPINYLIRKHGIRRPTEVRRCRGIRAQPHEVPRFRECEVEADVRADLALEKFL